MESNLVGKTISIDNSELIQFTCQKILSYSISFCKLFRAIGDCVDHYCPLRKDIKFYLYSTKLLGVVSLPFAVRKTFRSVKNNVENIVYHKTLQERLKSIFDLIVGVDKVLRSVFTVIKMIKTAERINSILRFWIPFYDVINLPIDAVKIILKTKTVYHYYKLRSDLLALEKKATLGVGKAQVLSEMLDRLSVEKINSLQKKLYVPKEIRVSEKISEYKKVLSTASNNEKTIEEISVFIQKLSTRLRVKCYYDRMSLANKVVGLIISAVSFSFVISAPICLVVPIITASASLLLKSTKDIAFRRCA